MLRILIKQIRTLTIQPSRQYARGRSKAGIRHQLAAETAEIEYDTHYDDDIGKYEGDLTNTSAVYQQYQQETVKEKKNLRRHIVRDKYFKEKQPTFLTWGEMEQIRLLNNSDPEEWNEHKLAESFPADALTIRKVLRAKWQPSDSKRMARHDEKVRSNWEAFANGEFKGMDPQLCEILKKFSKRNLNTKVNFDRMLKKEMPKPESTEFVGIISSCKKYGPEAKQISSKSDDNIPALPRPSANEYVPAKSVNSRKLYTFKPDTPDESVTVSSGRETIFNNPFGTGIKSQNDSTPSVTKFENTEVQLQDRDLKQLSISPIRERIDIPLKLFKKGATYRLADCYYDDDGEFLYRVPGMDKV